MKNLHHKLTTSWYQSNSWLTYFLLPLTFLFTLLVRFRRWLYKKNFKCSYKLDVPVIVVGNITVGGTGKTPLVIYLVDLLHSQGYRPGIISRGYGGDYKHCQLVTPKSNPKDVGDEAVLMATRTKSPLVVGRNRIDAAKELLSKHDCNIIISDDGLQHYALARDIEIIVIDGERRFGNGFLLPAGPLREPVERVAEANFVINNGKNIANEFMLVLQPDRLYNVLNPEEIKELATLQGTTVHGIAGIGNPARFFNTLRKNGVQVIPHAFADHYMYKAVDIAFDDTFAVIMTEKDAVKCCQFIQKNMWCLPVTAVLPTEFSNALLKYLQKIIMK